MTAIHSTGLNGERGDINKRKQEFGEMVDSRTEIGKVHDDLEDIMVLEIK